jgi:hypothetical protein
MWLRHCVALLFFFSIHLALASTPSKNYGEDLATKNLAAHSTFHYEFTRTLARAAGFTAAEAESLAVTDEATDTGSFTGETGVTIALNGTKRVSNVGQYWHFARRDSNNATNEYLYPGARNTCAYFSIPPRTCPGDEAELDEIERWAVYAQDTPQPGVPQVSLDAGQTFRAVAGKSLFALAIYLHALADSYSHEACMASAHVRTHKPLPPECSAVHWHMKAEFGSDPEIDKGVSYTREAGRATWLALKWFREKNGVADAPRWSDEQAFEFIENWIKLDKPLDRREFALKALAELQ